jgi:hypothetical protein
MKIDWCTFGFHQYRNWQVVGHGKIVDDSNVSIGAYRDLEASCKNCGRLKYKRVRLFA